MIQTNLGSNEASTTAGQQGRLVLLRHGQTVWSESGQYTGRTDIPLTEVGERQAIDAGVRLREAFPDGFAPGCVFASPLRRARQTAALAGYGAHKILDGIAEWDYGRAEGRTRCQIKEMSGLDWNVWTHGPQALDPAMEGDWVETLPSGEKIPVHNGAGETVNEVAERTRDVIEHVLPLLNEGHDVLLVAHAHVLRILATQWLGVEPLHGRLFRLDTAHYCVLTQYKGDNVIEHWNM